MALCATLLPATAGAGSHQTLAWNEDGAATTRVGANAQVTIYRGTADPDTCESIYPATDVYVVAESSLGGGQKLVDVSNPEGLPNTVFLASGGLFMDEPVAVIAPSGHLGTGTYGIVYDECQDGDFDAGVDKLFVGAIQVAIPANPPPINPAIAELKRQARAEANSWQSLVQAVEAVELLIELRACALAGPGGCALSWLHDKLQGHVKDQVMAGLGVTDPKDAAKKVVLNTIKHYGGIAADPPDPAFRQLSPLGSVEQIDAQSDDPVVAALVGMGNVEATESRILEALLHAMERYQGADAAADGEWALAHARAVRSYALVLAGQLQATNAALTALSDAVAGDGRNFDTVARGWDPIRGRISRTGFAPDELRALRNHGLAPSEIEALRLRIDAEPNLWFFSEGTVRSRLSTVINRNDTFRPHLETLASDMQAIIDTLLADPGVVDHLPRASAGGPYHGTVAAPLALDASASTDPDGGALAFAWDLDGDAQFDDATGAAPTVTFDRGFEGLVGVEVTDDTGRKDLAYAPASIGGANAPPAVVAASPAGSHHQVALGDALALSVSATDPEGDPLSVRWLVDHQPVATGAGFEYRPTGDPGLRLVRVEVSDPSGSGRSVAREWGVSVLAPDADGDGWTAGLDCDDAGPAVHPSRTEVLDNGVDDDCDAGTPDTAPGGVTGSLWSWGANHLGAVGSGAPYSSYVRTPTPIPGHDDVVQLDSYFRGGLAVRSNGEVLAWGSGLSGELGNGASNSITGSTTATNVPISPLPVGGGAGRLSGIVEVRGDGGNVHALARRADGSVLAWGDNTGRQLGDGTTVNARAYPMPVLTGPDGPPLAGVAAIEAGYNESHALMADGSVRTWGLIRCNGGPGLTRSPFPIPMPLVGGGVRQVSSGGQWNLFLKHDGTVLSCGRPVALGRPAFVGQDRIPGQVSGFGPGSGVVDVSAGHETGLALKADGTVWTWGVNANGSLDVIGVPPGQKAETPRQVPLPPGPPVVDIDQDNACHSLARRADGSVLVWGCNFFSQSGTGSSEGAIATPTLLELPGASAMAVSTSVWNSVVLARPRDEAADAAPELAPIGDQSVTELAQLTFTATATAADGDALAYSLLGAPEGAVIDATTGVFTWTPTEDQGPGSYTFSVQVSDGALSDEEEITVTVAEANAPPVLDALADQELPWGETLAVAATATDPDVPAQALAYSLVEAPAGAAIDPATGAVSWSPTAEQVGTHPVTVRVSDDGTPTLSDEVSFSVTVERRPTTVVYDGDDTAQYSDPAALRATLTDAGGGPRQDDALARATVDFSLGTQSVSGVTDAGGLAEAGLVLDQVPGALQVRSAFAGDARYLPSDDTDPFDLAQEATVVAVTGSTTLADARPATVHAHLADDDGAAVTGRDVELTIGAGDQAQTCTATTDPTGTGSCTIPTLSQPLGPGSLEASFAGDAFYTPATTTAPALVFAFPAGGSFVVGDEAVGPIESATGTGVTFWSSQWRQSNPLSSGPAPAGFKGFEDGPGDPTCGQSWTTSPGNSGSPPETVPTYTAVIVASSVTKSGSSITGDAVHVVVVRTQPGYGPDPGHEGTGTIAGVVC